MNKKKFLAAAAFAGALSAAHSAGANIIGVPSEGLLVPFGVQGTNSGNQSYPSAYTGVLIETPALVGADTIINDYTAPNTTKGGYTPPGNKGEWGGAMTVHYYMFDDRSDHVYDSTFVMSPDDVYFWVAPPNLFDYGEGGKDWVGYVVFADEAARKGGPATFVMTGQAGIAFDDFYFDGSLVDIPVVPLADGDDAGGIRIGNEITYSPQQLPRIEDVVPLVAGTRYYGAPGTTTTIVSGLVPLYLGAAYDEWGIRTIWHLVWLSENGMTADIDFCDDEENCVSCTSWTFNEVNALAYFEQGEVYDIAQGLKELFAFNPPEDCVGQECYPIIEPVFDTCAVTHYQEGHEGYDAGAGLAVYEFSSKAGVAGVNFQVGVSTISTTGKSSESSMTWPMTANGQF